MEGAEAEVPRNRISNKFEPFRGAKGSVRSLLRAFALELYLNFPRQTFFGLTRQQLRLPFQVKPYKRQGTCMQGKASESCKQNNRLIGW